MQEATKKYYGNGKLLLTGEYAVLDGAKALAIPTKFGQSLEVFKIKDGKKNISWKSFTKENKIWLDYNSSLNIENNEHLMLEKILNVIKNMNPNIFENNSFEFKTNLDFDRKWGLGSSSTLLYCLSKWADIDAFELLEKTFGGSGYDLACAGENMPLFFTKTNNGANWSLFDLDFSFKENLYFVYLGKKKNSREAINHYRESKSTKEFIKSISQLTVDFSCAKSLKELQEIMLCHENILSERLKTPTLNKSIFNDNKKIVAKSLGGWGGDFILLATDIDYLELQKYLLTKNLNVILRYDEMAF